MRHASARDEIAEARQIIFRRTFERDEKIVTIEPDAPMQVAGVVAKFEGGDPVPGREPKPAFRPDPHHHGPVRIQDQNGTVEQGFLAGQGDGDLLTAPRRRP